MVRRALIAWLLGLSFLGTVSGQSSSPRLTRVVPVRFYQTAKDSPITAVKPEQFVVKGMPAIVRSIEVDRGPRRIILLLDRSISMNQNRTAGGWQWAVRLAKAFLALMEREDQVSLNIFASKLVPVTTFTSDFAAVAKEIDALAPPNSEEARKGSGWATHLYDVLPSLLQSFGGDFRFGDSILIISDGIFPTGSQKIHQTLADSGVRVFLIFSTLPDIYSREYKFGELVKVGQFRPLTVSGEYEHGSSLIWETGGGIFDPWKDVLVHPGGFGEYSNEVLFPQTVRAAYQVLKNLYRFEIQLDAAIEQYKHFDIQLKDEQGKIVKDFLVVHPRYLGPVHAGTK